MRRFVVAVQRDTPGAARIRALAIDLRRDVQEGATLRPRPLLAALADSRSFAPDARLLETLRGSDRAAIGKALEQLIAELGPEPPRPLTA